MTAEADQLTADGWRQGADNLWRNDRFGGSYAEHNALARIGSRIGEVTREAPLTAAQRFSISRLRETYWHEDKLLYDETTGRVQMIWWSQRKTIDVARNGNRPKRLEVTVL